MEFLERPVSGLGACAARAELCRAKSRTPRDPSKSRTCTNHAAGGALCEQNSFGKMREHGSSTEARHFSIAKNQTPKFRWGTRPNALGGAASSALAAQEERIGAARLQVGLVLGAAASAQRLLRTFPRSIDVSDSRFTRGRVIGFGGSVIVKARAQVT